MKSVFIGLFLLVGINMGLCQDKPKVVATATMIWDMAKNIGGDHFEIQCIVPIGGDPHIYDPTPRDAKMVAAANLVLKNGLTFEGWLDDLITNSGTAAKVVTVTQDIPAIKSLTYKDAADPHAWMNMEYALTYIENIKNEFIELLPDQRAVFEKNYEDYAKLIRATDQYIKDRISTIPMDKRILITSHDAFQYFGRKYGLRLEAILGTSTDAEAQTSDIKRLNKVIQESKVPAVFIESTINPKLLQQLAKDNDIIIGGELFADSIGDEESGADTYINMMKHNTDTIVEGLLREPSKEEDDESSENTVWLYALIGVLLIGGFFVVARFLNN